MNDKVTIRIKIDSNLDLNHLPKYNSDMESGADVKSASDYVILRGETKLIKTGIRVEIPKDYEIQVRSRSGLALKSSIFVLNSPGTIDESYRGEIGVILHNAGEESFDVRKGDRIAQLVLQRVPKIEWETTDDLSESIRNENGFGSSGIN